MGECSEHLTDGLVLVGSPPGLLDGFNMLALRDGGAQAIGGAKLLDGEDVMDKQVLAGKAKAIRAHTGFYEDGMAIMKVLEHFIHGLKA